MTRPDLDLRLVRYFTVVAEHQSFSRAAAVLHVAQPSLSRQIRRLEEQVGARLIDRTPQGSSLTPAGRTFLTEAKLLLSVAEQATLAARGAGSALTIGHVSDLVISPIVQELRRRFPSATIRTRHLTWKENNALTEHRVDALVTRLPLPPATAGLRVQILYAESRVALLPRSHPLAGRASLTPTDLAAEKLVACAYTPTMWSRPPDPDDSFEDKLELIANGAVAILPAGDRRSTLHPGVATVPMTGIDPCQVVALSRADDRNPLTAAFHEATSASPATDSGGRGSRTIRTGRDLPS
jgi:DNA-binding transcriptional LysR family regulator